MEKMLCKSGLPKYVMCINIGSCQNVQEVLLDVLLLASCDPNLFLEPTSKDAHNDILAAKHPIGIPMHLHSNVNCRLHNAVQSIQIATKERK